MRFANDRRGPVFAIFFGLFLLWGFGWETVGRRIRTEITGVIIESRDVPSTGAPRYATEYTVRGVDGKEKKFWAGPTDGSLSRSMPVGTHIRKERWRLDYERDGRTERFPYVFYEVVLSLAMGSVVWGLWNTLMRRR